MDVIYHTDEVLELRPRLWRVLLVMGSVFFLAGFAMFLLFEQVATLECSRRQTGEPDCVLTHLLLGFSINQLPINHLYDARVEEYRDSDNDTTYKIILDTENGSLPVTSYSSSGKQNKMNVVTEITTFLDNNQEQTLSVQDGRGISSMIPLVFSLTGLVEVIFGVFIRKSFWRLSKTENLITHYRPGLSGGRVTQLYLADITGAEVSSSRDSDGDRTYRVAFTTKSGDRIPMTSWYSSGYQRKQDTATLICDFISHT